MQFPLLLVSLCARPPNFVLIVVDDYGHSDVGYNMDLLLTPHLDELAATGIKLSSYYVQPICTPTRSQLMSGRYQIHTGLQHGVIHPEQPYGLPTDIQIVRACTGSARALPTDARLQLPQLLAGQGYRAHLIGKWHLGFFTNRSCPWHRGFGPAEGSSMGYLGACAARAHRARGPRQGRRDGGLLDKGARPGLRLSGGRTRLPRMRNLGQWAAGEVQHEAVQAEGGREDRRPRRQPLAAAAVYVLHPQRAGGGGG